VRSRPGEPWLVFVAGVLFVACGGDPKAEYEEFPLEQARSPTRMQVRDAEASHNAELPVTGGGFPEPATLKELSRSQSYYHDL
jgi:hypothetical protein